MSSGNFMLLVNYNPLRVGGGWREHHGGSSFYLLGHNRVQTGFSRAFIKGRLCIAHKSVPRHGWPRQNLTTSINSVACWQRAVFIILLKFCPPHINLQRAVPALGQLRGSFQEGVDYWECALVFWNTIFLYIWSIIAKVPSKPSLTHTIVT